MIFLVRSRSTRSKCHSHGLEKSLRDNEWALKKKKCSTTHALDGIADNITWNHTDNDNFETRSNSEVLDSEREVLRISIYFTNIFFLYIKAIWLQFLSKPERTLSINMK